MSTSLSSSWSTPVTETQARGAAFPCSAHRSPGARKGLGKRALRVRTIRQCSSLFLSSMPPKLENNTTVSVWATRQQGELEQPERKRATDQEVHLLTTSLAMSHSDKSYRISRNVSSFNPGISHYRRVSLSWQRPYGESSPCWQTCGHILTTVWELRTILTYFRGHEHCVFPRSPTVKTPSRSRTIPALEIVSRKISACTNAILDNDNFANVSGRSGSCFALRVGYLGERRV